MPNDVHQFTQTNPVHIVEISEYTMLSRDQKIVKE